jgi:hypothetical protein
LSKKAKPPSAKMGVSKLELATVSETARAGAATGCEDERQDSLGGHRGSAPKVRVPCGNAWGRIITTPSVRGKKLAK